MRGKDIQQSTMFSYLPQEERVPANHRPRRMRPMVEAALAAMLPPFDKKYSAVGRPSIAPERISQGFASANPVRHSQRRLLMEQLSFTCCSAGSPAAHG